MVFDTETRSRNFSANYTISNENITKATAGMFTRNYDTGNISGDNTGNSNIKIHKVICCY